MDVRKRGDVDVTVLISRLEECKQLMKQLTTSVSVREQCLSLGREPKFCSGDDASMTMVEDREPHTVECSLRKNPQSEFIAAQISAGASVDADASRQSSIVHDGAGRVSRVSADFVVPLLPPSGRHQRHGASVNDSRAVNASDADHNCYASCCNHDQQQQPSLVQRVANHDALLGWREQKLLAALADDEEDADVVISPYESEEQLEPIMRLITKDLSEPYSIYTYRYFIHNWPNLCFLVSERLRA